MRQKSGPEGASGPKGEKLDFRFADSVPNPSEGSLNGASDGETGYSPGFVDASEKNR
jgi:hypothetical protein